MLVAALLDLKQAQGATASEVWAQIATLCPDQQYSLHAVNLALSKACSRGMLLRQRSAPEDEWRFLVLGYMSLYNTANRPYSRWPCQSNSFWRS